ncbi:MAG TPA: hypothetical protein VLA82_03510 [Actinomycetota bacterium]|nr:hypothetical protein [Actinomycetota bacterium]
MIDDRRTDEPGDDLASPRTNRGFWTVAGTMALVSIVVVVAIVANLGMKDTIAHAQHSLLMVRSAAQSIRTETGSYEAAGATGLALADIEALGPDEASTGLDEVSVYAATSTWAAAVQARTGACFYLRIDSSGATTYGSGTVCTGREAERLAADSGW